jgi:hypothetical protein
MLRHEGRDACAPGSETFAHECDDAFDERIVGAEKIREMATAVHMLVTPPQAWRDANTKALQAQLAKDADPKGRIDGSGLQVQRLAETPVRLRELAKNATPYDGVALRDYSAGVGARPSAVNSFADSSA